MATKKVKEQKSENIAEIEKEKANEEENKKVDKKANETLKPKIKKEKKNTNKSKNVKKEKDNKVTENKVTENKKKAKKTKEGNEKIKEMVEKVNQYAKDEEIEKEENAQIIEKPQNIEIEEIKKTIKNKKELPKEEIKKINKILFRNIIVAIVIVTYFIFLNLGKMNIENSVYVTDLKVFSMCTLLSAIVLIEIAYKKDSGEIALYGVEMIVLAITTFALIYINLMLSSRYTYIVTAISAIFAIYYLIKSIVIYLKKRKQYFVNDIKDIMNKEEVE